MPRGGRRLPEGCMELLQRASVIVHTGDLTAATVLEELAALAPVEAVHGNMDALELRGILPERRVVEAEGLRVGVVHDAGPSAGRHERLAGWFPDCDLLAYGHTHLPEVARHDEAWIVNPGSPTERRRAPGHTMAVVRDGAPVLVRLD
ncbi:MAG TPA: metallophosphoesterase family protein [Gaiellaceae bacterium]|nr:metallophosphoesterase family protein [Gaiellaceae bacterium]